MNDAVAAKLSSAILLLAKELKRFNDSREPKPRTASPAEYYKGAYSQDEIDRRAEAERLSLLKPAISEPVGTVGQFDEQRAERDTLPLGGDGPSDGGGAVDNQGRKGGHRKRAGSV